MNNIGILIEALSDIIDNKQYKKDVLPATKLYKVLDFFFRRGNAGINALRELLEDMNQYTVDVFFDNDGEKFECRVSICYEYHDIDIIEYSENKNPSEYCYQLVDTSREEIEKTKKAFKDLKF